MATYAYELAINNKKIKIVPEIMTNRVLIDRYLIK